MLTFAICSSVTRPVLKQACPSEKIISHANVGESCNTRVCYVVDKMGDARVRF